MKIQIKGWAAIPAVLVCVAFVGYRAVSARTALDGAAGSALRAHLQGVYSSQQIPALRASVADGDTENLAAQVRGVLDLRQIELTTLGVKGTGTEVVAKVGVRVAGQTPPDGKSQRYFILRHVLATEWRVVRECTAWTYYTKLF